MLNRIMFSVLAVVALPGAVAASTLYYAAEVEGTVDSYSFGPPDLIYAVDASGTMVDDFDPSAMTLADSGVESTAPVVGDVGRTFRTRIELWLDDTTGDATFTCGLAVCAPGGTAITDLMPGGAFRHSDGNGWSYGYDAWFDASGGRISYLDDGYYAGITPGGINWMSMYGLDQELSFRVLSLEVFNGAPQALAAPGTPQLAAAPLPPAFLLLAAPLLLLGAARRRG